MFCQQQQVLNQQLSIEQLLRAAKLIEQRAIIEKMPSSHFEGYNNSSDKFGEKYESRILAPKLRTIVSDVNNIGQSSTGSSLRSSPLSVNSPSPDLAVLACLHSPQQQLTFIDQQQQRQSTSTSSASSSIASNCSMITTDAAQRLSSSLDDNLTPSVSHSAGRRCSGGSRQSRAAHNELEKNRRANLRGHLEALKSILPPENDTHRDTTLSLLTRARNYIRSIEEQKSELIKKREALLAEHQHLKNLLKQNNNEEKEIQQKYNENLTNERQNYEKEEEEEEKKLNFIQYEFNKQFCNNKKDEKFKEIKKTSPTIDEYLSFNGLIPSLPLLYPYSFNNNN